MIIHMLNHFEIWLFFFTWKLLKQNLFKTLNVLTNKAKKTMLDWNTYSSDNIHIYCMSLPKWQCMQQLSPLSYMATKERGWALSLKNAGFQISALGNILPKSYGTTYTFLSYTVHRPAGSRLLHCSISISEGCASK